MFYGIIILCEYYLKSIAHPESPTRGEESPVRLCGLSYADGINLLMIHSACDGDYKFPGGGIKPGEDHFTALSREVREESGAVLLKEMTDYGRVIEYDRPIEKQFDLFVMTSYYYLCRIESQIGMQSLEKYELELGFTPEWISIADALAVNQTLQRERPEKLQRWVRRETQVLQLLLKDQTGR